MHYILVSRFVADGLVQQASEDAVMHDNEEEVEVHIAPSDIDFSAVEQYVAEQFGDDEQSKKDAAESVSDDFDVIDRQSTEIIAFYWED